MSMLSPRSQAGAEHHQLGRAEVDAAIRDQAPRCAQRREHVQPRRRCRALSGVRAALSVPGRAQPDPGRRRRGRDRDDDRRLQAAA